jgi:hypothetical protein
MCVNVDTTKQIDDCEKLKAKKFMDRLRDEPPNEGREEVAD